MNVAEVREVAGGRTNGIGDLVSEKVLYATLQGFVIKGDAIVWTVQVLLPPATLLRRPKRPNVTVRAPVKYCYEKGKFYLLDDDAR